MKHCVMPIFEKSRSGRRGVALPALDVPETSWEKILPAGFARKKPLALPEVSEVDVVRHFTGLSQLNFGVDEGFYPLGSCTMKYNPKINENAARMPGFAAIHPLQGEETVQGALELLFRLQHMLAEITGMRAVTLQPAAGAHGEFTGILLIRAYHDARGERQRRTMIVPDTAHGTNPASAAVAGFDVVQVPSNDRGNVDLEALRGLLDHRVAGIMLTNPNTLGLFEEQIAEVAALVHDAGGLLYYDGANANAILGKVRPGDMGFDVLHLNLHKTFSTPHGGGGPGAGPVGVGEKLVPFLPKPVVLQQGDRYVLDFDRPQSIGRVRSFFGNFGVLVRAYTYILSMGPDGLREVAENAVLNANYLMALLGKRYEVKFPGLCKHEFVLSARRQKEAQSVTALDLAKRLIDFGIHPPTIYFPLLVEEALMVEPTETEGKETLDLFAETMLAIADEAENNPAIFAEAPHTTARSRFDETLAARNPVLRWTEETSGKSCGE